MSLRKPKLGFSFFAFFYLGGFCIIEQKVCVFLEKWRVKGSIVLVGLHC